MSEEAGRGVAHTVPVGTVVEVHLNPFDGDKLIEVTWDGREVMMFTQDLRLRAQRLDGASLAKRKFTPDPE